MAYPNLKLIHSLRETASRLREGVYYAWGNHGACNCGNLLLGYLPGGFRWLKRNVREDVILYFETFAKLLEEKLTAKQLEFSAYLCSSLPMPVR